MRQTADPSLSRISPASPKREQSGLERQSGRETFGFEGTHAAYLCPYPHVRREFGQSLGSTRNARRPIWKTGVTTLIVGDICLPSR